MRLLKLIISIVLINVFTCINFATDLNIENEFIKIVVNNSDSKGRFSLETTLGNPDLEKDNFQDLIYGKPSPWTSYTTFLINKTPYIFGNEGKKLKRRSSFQFNYLPLANNIASNNTIISYASLDKLDFMQKISFYKNPNTNLKDSILISYTITNNDTISHDVGTRILLDTKLGPNDGAPLRLGNQAISNEIKLNKSELYAYWQAFDSLVSPNIIAQGLLSDTNKQLSLPDFVHLANWGSLVDTPWDVEYIKDRSFIRTGEKEKDTALALTYLAQPIAPSSSITINTVYGLGGLSLSEGELSLGLSAPKELSYNYSDSFLIVGYLFNSSNFDAHNTTIKVELPSNLKLIQGKTTMNIDILKSKDQIQIPLLVKLKKPKTGLEILRINVESETFDPNTISREIDFIGPSKLEIDSKSDFLINQDNQYFVIESTITNPSRFAVKNINVSLSNSDNIIITSLDSSTKNIPVLQAFESLNIQWAIDGKNINKTKNLRLNVQSSDALFSSKPISIIPKLNSHSILNLDAKLKKDNQLFFVLKLNAQKNTSLKNYTLKYDTKLVNFFHFVSLSNNINVKKDKKNSLIKISSDKAIKDDIVLYFKTKSNQDLLFELISDNNKLDEIIIKQNN